MGDFVVRLTSSDKFYNNNYLTICSSSSWNHLDLSYRSSRPEVFFHKGPSPITILKRDFIAGVFLLILRIF